ncbi:DUF6883 domain-containing protein [Methylobacterium trifolii]|uniref:DUF6883 domain-containing protein n=1 Tax=Methylobacterium trifolii TaxID=1003092 RepID=A0ABQ4U2J1_9HYPH|nr:DUF6883 domain-containing protein [Methylobacterium trifolii]GJE60966.1 hypothetical protein MPOCJGCO_3085 [Methylobacterium trifolii]
MNGSRPDPAGFAIPASKIVDYLLNLSHPRGGAKARFFLGFSFSPDDPAGFADALLDHVRMTPPQAAQDGSPKLVFEGVIRTPDGRAPWIRSIWLVEPDGTARLVSAVPMRRRSGGGGASA